MKKTEARDCSFIITNVVTWSEPPVQEVDSTNEMRPSDPMTSLFIYIDGWVIHPWLFHATGHAQSVEGGGGTSYVYRDFWLFFLIRPKLFRNQWGQINQKGSTVCVGLWVRV